MERIRPTSAGTQPGASQAPRPASGGPSVSSKVLVSSLIVVGVVLLLVIAGAFAKNFFGGVVDKDKYQAVFLTNGQVYFGKLSNIHDGYVRLNDIYYLQVTQTEAEQALQDQENQNGQQPQISLAKLGNELHAPEDEMFISRDQILFWENRKAEGLVTEAILEYVENGGTTNTNTNDAGAGGTQPADDTAEGEE